MGGSLWYGWGTYGLNGWGSYDKVSCCFILLPMVSKVLERHFHQLISEFISKNNILTDDQFGFQPGRCTTTPLLLPIHEWHKELESRKRRALLFCCTWMTFQMFPCHLKQNLSYLLMTSFKPMKSDSEFFVFQDIDAINNCTVANYLSLNANKPNSCLFLQNMTMPTIFTERYPDKVSHFKYLGIWLSDDLTWSTHIEHVCCKARRLLIGVIRLCFIWLEWKLNTWRNRAHEARPV